MIFTWILAHLALVFGMLLAGVAMAHMLRQKRAPQATAAWLLIIVLVPYVGVPLYLALGARKVKGAGGKEEMQMPPNESGDLVDGGEIDHLLRSYGMPGATHGNRVSLCADGEEAYRHLVTLIESARHRLDIETFILHPDEVGREIIARLTRRAEAGIAVRVLLDGVGSMHTRRGRDLASLLDAGGRVAFFNRMLHFPLHGRTNLRDHRKIVIADGVRVMAGGTNIASEYIGPGPSTTRWIDLSFILEGPAVAQYERIFRADWAYAAGESLEPVANAPAAVDRPGAIAQVEPSGPDMKRDVLYDAFLSMIFAAKTRFWIVTPYFVPDEALAQAMVLAAHRGVDVRVVVPEVSNHRLADLARDSYLRDIQAAGGRIVLYTQGMVHAKVALMDDAVASVGSANMDMRSLFLNYEVALFLHSPPEVAAIAAWIDRVSAGARVGVPQVGAARDMAEGLVRMLAPLL
jgi:cardiolipin synthase